MRPLTPFAAAVLAWLVMLPGAPERAAAATKAPIYSCVDANGKRLTSDRPIPECNNREQRVLNADGSVKKVVPPTPTADERADIEARDRQAALDRATRLEAIRRDRNLLARFPNEAAHQKARTAALDDTRKALRLSESRLALLAKERKPLVDEAEFYVGRVLPPLLKQQLDANDAATDAQKNLMQNQQAELLRIDTRYDLELERLRQLWSGAHPGSLGALPRVEAASAPTGAVAPK